MQRCPGPGGGYQCYSFFLPRILQAIKRGDPVERSTDAYSEAVPAFQDNRSASGTIWGTFFEEISHFCFDRCTHPSMFEI